MLSLATVVTTLLRLRARACVVLACIAVMLCTASIASANPSVQPQTRVWDFSFAQPLNTWLERSASPRTHPENRSGSFEPASVSPHAAKAGAEVAPRVLNAANHVFGPKSIGKHGLEGVLKSFGGDKVAAFNALERGAQQLANQGAIKGVFQTSVEVAGQSVTVRGAVVEGTARVSTAFIPIP